MQGEHLGFDKFYLEEATCLAFVNGHLSLEDSRLNELPDELVISDIQTAKRNYKDLFERLALTHEQNLGFFCYVPKNTVVAHELQLVFVGSRPSQLNHLIYLEEGARLTLFESYHHSAANHQIKHRIYLGANAELNYYKLQNEAAEVVHQDEFFVQQARDSRFKSTVISLGAKTSRDVLRVQLQESNASCELRAFYQAQAKQYIVHNVEVEHLSAYCTSHQLYKTIATDQGHAAFKGRVKVYPKAQKTEAHQLNQNLLLSSKAEIDAKPELEIYADDVKCSHGSTIGQLDIEALFYLRSRGLSLREARHMLTCAFAMSVLDGVAHPLIVAYLEKIIIDDLTTTSCGGVCQDE